MKIIEVNQDFGTTHAPQTEFAYSNMDHDSVGFPRTLKEIYFVEKSIKKYNAKADKKKREKIFEEKYMMMLYLRRGRMTT